MGLVPDSTYLSKAHPDYKVRANDTCRGSQKTDDFDKPGTRPRYTQLPVPFSHENPFGTVDLLRVVFRRRMSLRAGLNMSKHDGCGSPKLHTHTPIALRTPLHCGLSILVCSCLFFGAQQCRAHAQQDVAEAARQERARKDQSKKARHVYTDEDLKHDKILTPEDEARMAADRKQTPPVESAADTLDASADVGQLPLGDIARRYRNAKRALQAPPFHLPFDEPVLAEPLFAAPEFVAPVAPAPVSPEPVAPVVSAPAVVTSRSNFAPVRPRISPSQPKAAAGPAMNQPALRRVDPFARRLTPAAPSTIAPTQGASHRAIPAPPAPSVVPKTPKIATKAPQLSGAQLTFPQPSNPAVMPAPAKPHLALSAPPAPSAIASAPNVAPMAPQLKGLHPGFESSISVATPAPAQPRVTIPPAPAPSLAPSTLNLTPIAPQLESTATFAQPAGSISTPAPAKPHIAISTPPSPLVAPSTTSAAPAAPRFSVLRPTFTAPSAPEIAPAPAPEAPADKTIAAPPSPSAVPSAPKAAPAPPRFSLFRRTFTPPTVSEIAPVPPAPVAPAVTAPWVAPVQKVVVQPGDSLWSLAVQHLGRGSRWHELLASNPSVMDPKRIAVGTEIVVPENASSRVTVTDKVIVQKGDTLSKIAQAQYRRGTAWRCIAAANPQIQDANRIFEGQELLLPANCER
jgi:nucleoid-associated protein YgaU